MNIDKAQTLELCFDQIAGHRLVLGTGNPSPVAIAVVAAPPRNRHDVIDNRFHAASVDVGVDAVGRAQRRARYEGLVANAAVSIEKGLNL